MSAENQGISTLNPPAGSSPSGIGTEAAAPTQATPPAQPQFEETPGRFKSDGDLVSTMEVVRSVVPANPPAGTTEPATTDGAGKANAEPGPEGEPSAEENTRFDKHPRFQQLIQSNRELKEQNVKLLDAFSRIQGGGQGDGQRPAPGGAEQPALTSDALSQLLSKSDEEILEMQASDPKGFIKTIVSSIAGPLRDQIQNDVMNQINQRSTESRIEATYAQFEKDHPDFGSRWADGTIGRFMQEHPGHNAISAYAVLTAEETSGKTQKQIDEAVKKAVKDTEARVLKEVRAKGGSAVLGAGPAAQPSPSPINDPRLKNPKDYGGATTVLADRLAERRRQGL